MVVGLVEGGAGGPGGVGGTGGGEAAGGVIAVGVDAAGGAVDPGALEQAGDGVVVEVDGGGGSGAEGRQQAAVVVFVFVLSVVFVGLAVNAEVLERGPLGGVAASVGQGIEPAVGTIIEGGGVVVRIGGGGGAVEAVVGGAGLGEVRVGDLGQVAAVVVFKFGVVVERVGDFLMKPWASRANCTVVWSGASF